MTLSESLKRLYQRAFIRCTVVACHVVERPDGSAYPAKNMLEKQLAALACEDWGDFRT